MRTNSNRFSNVGPATIAIIGIFAIGVGAAIKTGFIRIGRASQQSDATTAVKTGAGEVAMPASSSDPVHAARPRAASPPTPPALANDTLVAPAATEDSNAVRPSPAELSDLSAALIVPVAGVLPKDLLDTFDEPRGTRRHNALDIPAPRGTPVLSAADGRLQRMFTSEAGGLMVYASDPTDRFVLMYAHLDRYADGVTDGMRLRRGDTIGYVGTTGNAPPNLPHLHFAIARTTSVVRWWTGMPVDPRPLLRR
ncbi:MAG TPA: peptidoglycan DD-metalloendopeptidase family protein [Gemmatimonadaceae bacterium]|nr:peptidoglycan DD-metalloendopeptidase family protein [Gemmatimonadaceae bacterium]